MRTEFNQSNPTVTGSHTSIANRGVSRSEPSDLFSQSLTTAADRLAREKSPGNVLPISTLTRTAPLFTQQADATENRAASQSEGTSQTQQTESSSINTPFGKYDRTVPGAATENNGEPPDQVRDYFRTAQPGEWKFNAKARDLFAGIYGEKALVTLDWLGTVPEHLNPVWQTDQQTDSRGMPLPKKIGLGGLT